jgi:hypothetical protein
MNGIFRKVGFALKREAHSLGVSSSSAGFAEVCRSRAAVLDSTAQPQGISS